MIIGHQKFITKSRKILRSPVSVIRSVGRATFIFCAFPSFALISIFSAQKIQAQTSQTTCVRAGCSGELCISTQDANANGGLSTICLFRDEYACYQQAECGVLSSGQCGWLPTVELSQCVQNAQGDPVVTGDDRCALTGEGCDDPTDDQEPDFTIDPETGLCKTADLTGDSRTDIQDYTFLISQFMTTGAHSTLPADLNCDGIVDLIDYSLLKRNFNL